MEIWLGWISSFILLATLAGQVHQQWAADSIEGVSPWLFFGQISASSGFIGYSVLIGNPVFIVTNSLILLTAIAGQLLFWHRTRERASASRTTENT